MQLRLSKIKILGLIICSIFIGYGAQQYSISNDGPIPFGYNQIGFTLLIPLSVLLFIGFLHIVKIKSKILVTILSALLFGFIFIFNHVMYPITGGSTGDMYDLLLILWLPPSLLVGTIYGLYIAFNLDKETTKFERLTIYSTLILIIVFIIFLILRSSTCSFNKDHFCLSRKAVENNDINICYKAKSDYRVELCLFYTYTDINFTDKSCEKITTEWSYNDCLRKIALVTRNREICSNVKPIKSPTWAPVKNQQDCLNYIDSGSK